MNEHEWSDKILQGLHNASEMLAERRELIDVLRAERDAAREDASKAAERQMVAWVGRVQEHDRKWHTAMAILRMSGELQGPDDVLETLRATVEERDELSALNRRQGEALHEARAEAKKQHENAVEQNRLLKCALGELDDARNEIANLSDVLDAIGAMERTAECATTLAAGTGPVAVPETASEPATMPGDIDGTLAVVARHSREIGTLQDECRALRERLAEVEQRHETAICEDCGYRYRKPEDTCPSCGRDL